MIKRYSLETNEDQDLRAYDSLIGSPHILLISSEKEDVGLQGIFKCNFHMKQGDYVPIFRFYYLSTCTGAFVLQRLMWHGKQV